MIKKLFFILAFAPLAFSCNTASNGDPKAVLTNFFDAMSKKDFATAKKLSTKESATMFSFIETGMKEFADSSKDNTMDKFDKSKFEFGDPKIDGDKATVSMKDKKSGESTNFTLKKEEGSWKVAFDKTSIMQMATDKMKENGMDPSKVADSIGGALDKLKNMNTDSLADKMKEGINKMKELQKNNPEALQKMQDALKKAADAAGK